MRDKKTDPADMSELPDLTENQLAFVQALAGGKGVLESYKEAYDTSGYSSDAAVSVEASRAKANPKISLWLEAIRAAGLKEGLVSLNEHLQELDRIKSLATQSGNYGAAVKAEELRAKASGLYVEKHEHKDVTEQSAIEDFKRLCAANVLKPEAIRGMALDLGLNPDDYLPKESLQ